jgi:hypothetical protein
MASRRRALADAERRGIWVLRGLSGLALALAVLALTVAAGGVRPALAYGAIGLVLAGPLVRLAVPARRWVRPPDRRFLVLAAVVAVVLPVVAAVVTAGG